MKNGMFLKIKEEVFKLFINKEISTTAFKIYCYLIYKKLVSFSGDNNGEFDISYTELSKVLKIRRNDINTAINQLVNHRLIGVKKELRKSNIFYIL